MSAVLGRIEVNQFLENHKKYVLETKSGPDIQNNWIKWTGIRADLEAIHISVRWIDNFKKDAEYRTRKLFSNKNCLLISLNEALFQTGCSTAKTLIAAHDCGVLNGKIRGYLNEQQRYPIMIQELIQAWAPEQIIDERMFDMISALTPKLDQMHPVDRRNFFQGLAFLSRAGLALNEKNCSPFLKTPERAKRIAEVATLLLERGVRSEEMQGIFDFLAEMLPNITYAQFETVDLHMKGLVPFQLAGLMEDPKIRASVIQNPVWFLKATHFFTNLVNEQNYSIEQENFLYRTIFQNLDVFQEAYDPLTLFNMMDRKAFDLIMKLLPEFEKTDSRARPLFFLGAVLLKHSGLSWEGLNCPNLLACPLKIVNLVKIVDLFRRTKMPLAGLQIAVGLVTDMLPTLDLPVTPHLIESLYGCKLSGLLETPANRAWVIQHPHSIMLLAESVRALEDEGAFGSRKREPEILNALAEILPTLNDSDFRRKELIREKLLAGDRPSPPKRAKLSEE